MYVHLHGFLLSLSKTLISNSNKTKDFNFFKCLKYGRYWLFGIWWCPEFPMPYIRKPKRVSAKVVTCMPSI